jgi:hypothetical protein
MIKASAYDQRCQADADCIAIGEGNACVSCGLSCTNAAIAQNAQQQYLSDIAKIGQTMDPTIMVGCNCPAALQACCINATLTRNARRRNDRRVRRA